jgi:hypothetical protein
MRSRTARGSRERRGEAREGYHPLAGKRSKPKAGIQALRSETLPCSGGVRRRVALSRINQNGRL